MAKGFKFTFELRPFVLKTLGGNILGLIAWLDLCSFRIVWLYMRG